MSKIQLGSEGESLVRDHRLQKVFWALGRLVEMPENMEFLTQRQEPVEVDGAMQDAVAIFYVISPHPSHNNSKVITPAKLISVATMPYEQWASANQEYRHYAGLADPLRPIFAGLLRQHMTHRKNLEELQVQ